jgi:hypothetical protein
VIGYDLSRDWLFWRVPAAIDARGSQHPHPKHTFRRKEHYGERRPLRRTKIRPDPSTEGGAIEGGIAAREMLYFAATMLSMWTLFLAASVVAVMVTWSP